MQEDFLHYLWQHKKINLTQIQTTAKETIIIKSVGQPNTNSGPDFFNSHLQIGDQLWAGNVEIHIKSSDWFLHNHEQDKAYDNVILHVVWEHDTEVFNSNNTHIPTLELKHYVTTSALKNYNNLLNDKKQWINCENDFPEVDDFLIQNWLERLYIERLENKAESINQLLKNSNNDWEAVLFKMLAKSFGLKVNGDAFLSLANSVDFAVIRKLQSKRLSLEALFFGQSGILEQKIEDSYFLDLKKEYEYLKTKFQLTNNTVTSVQYFRLRPYNFPTIRLSQLARLYANEQNLFSKVIDTKELTGFYDLFSVGVSEYWETHYSFGTTSKLSKKRLTKSFIQLLLINAIIPLKFTYAKFQGKEIDGELIEIMQKVTSEKNSIIDKFNSLKKVSISALQSQALLQLKNEYCSKNKCLHCAIGNSLLNRN